MSTIPSNSSPHADSEPAGENTAAEAGQQLVGLKKNLEEAARQIGSLQSLLATQHQLEQLLKQGRAHLEELRGRLQQVTAERDDLRIELQKATAERTRLASQLAEQQASHQQVLEERSDERNTFERLLLESTSNQREMAAELDEQRQQIETLRAAAIRAQALAREIMRAHETLQTKTAGEPKD
jgi:chromosome segregation ATPase